MNPIGFTERKEGYRERTVVPLPLVIIVLVVVVTVKHLATPAIHQRIDEE